MYVIWQRNICTHVTRLLERQQSLAMISSGSFFLGASDGSAIFLINMQ